MNVAVLTYDAPAVAQQRTASGSLLGRLALRELMMGLAGPTSPPIVSQPITLADRLASVRRETESAIRARREYLGQETADTLVVRTRAIFDDAEWPEGEPLPSVTSIVGTLRAVASIGGEPSLGVSGSGNLTATWQEPDRSISVEGTSNGKLTWAFVIEGPDDFELLGKDEGSLSEVLQAIQGQ